MAVPSYGNDLIPFCESQGLAVVRRLRHVDNHFHSLDWPGVDRWILTKESELRDESTRKQASAAERAARYAMYAAVIAAIAALVANRDDIFKFIFGNL